MAVTFISNGYDTTSTTPYTEVAWADAHPSIGLATYGVRSPLHWKVSAVAGADRTVSIAAGQGFGHGVTDKTVANDTIQLDAITSGSRWDLIAVRRDWTPTVGESKFVKVNGGATAVIPGGRLYGPGNIDDQPLALVQVTAGQTQPTGFIDLRTWAGDGGGLIGAHDLVRSFLNKAGTKIHVQGVDWLRRVGVNDTPEWFKITDETIVFEGYPNLGPTNANGDGTYRFPTPFPNGTKSIQITDNNPVYSFLGAVHIKIHPGSVTREGFDFKAYSGKDIIPNAGGLLVCMTARGW